ncbi:MAG TPA: hypothetical protein VHC90_04785 [Bryobacteraceae bacterium]|nr:hypothetical protein [Bryobacteraceae bacterium]
MTPQHQAREQVIAAGRRLQEAAARWDATDPAAMESCAFSLEQTALELGEMLQTVHRIAPENRAELATELLQIKNDAARLSHLTDASAAFLRCAPGAEGGVSDFYSAAAARYSIPESEPRGTEA